MWNVIQKRLDEMNMNQADLARQLHVSRMEITRIKNGKKISLVFGFKLADVLKIDVNEFRKEYTCNI